jgi:hypothetical protein
MHCAEVRNVSRGKTCPFTLARATKPPGAPEDHKRYLPGRLPAGDPTALSPKSYPGVGKNFAGLCSTQVSTLTFKKSIKMANPAGPSRVVKETGSDLWKGSYV